MKLRAPSRLLAICALLVALTSSLVAQASDTVYVTRTGKKYHRAGCTSLRSSSIAMPLKDAAATYEPCKICHPPVPGGASPARAGSATAAAGSSAAAKPAPSSGTVQSTRCQATTKKGTQCSRKAKPGSRYCWQHGG